jgi:hypothetical protein
VSKRWFREMCTDIVSSKQGEYGRREDGRNDAGPWFKGEETGRKEQ